MVLDLTKPTPLYRQIVDDIKLKIKKGHLAVDDSIGSHQTLAAYYNVSLITVKRAINDLINENVLYSRVGKGTYVAGTREKIEIKEYVTIGLVLRDLDSPYFSRIVESVERYISETGCHLLVATSANLDDIEDQKIQNYLDHGVSGLLITTSTQRSRASNLIRNLHQQRFPYVILSYIEDTDINYIGTDQVSGAFKATEHLIKLGYDNIGYINNEAGYPLGEVRKRGYLKALRQFGKEYNQNFEFRLRRRGGWHEYNSGYEIGKKFIESKPKPDAMFVYNDLSALGFERALLDAGFRVPEDVAIVGFDNIKRGVVAPVPLTTINQPTEKIGQMAIEMVLAMIDRKQIDRRIILEPNLVIRESCGAMIRGTNRKNKFNKISALINQE